MVPAALSRENCEYEKEDHPLNAENLPIRVAYSYGTEQAPIDVGICAS